MRPLAATRPLAVFVLALSFSACAGSREAREPRHGPLPDRFPYHSAEEIQRYLAEVSDTLVSFSSKSSAAIADPNGSGHFTAEVHHRRNDSVRIDVRVQLGIHAARILLTTDSLFVYDRVKKVVYYGDTESAGSLLPMPWRSPNLFLDILGLPKVPIDSTWSVSADSARYYLTSLNRRHVLFVDPSTWRIVRSESRAEEGTLIEERTFLDFDEFDGVLLPRRIVVRRPPDRVSATITHRSIVLNPDHLDLEFHVADDARYERIP